MIAGLEHGATSLAESSMFRLLPIGRTTECCLHELDGLQRKFASLHFLNDQDKALDGSLLLAAAYTALVPILRQPLYGERVVVRDNILRLPLREVYLGEESDLVINLKPYQAHVSVGVDVKGIYPLTDFRRLNARRCEKYAFGNGGYHIALASDGTLLYWSFVARPRPELCHRIESRLYEDIVPLIGKLSAAVRERVVA